MYQYCRVHREDRILVITLDRPGVLNSLNASACFELDQIFSEFEADPELWIGIVTGAGERAFCAGHDLADAPDAPMPKGGWAGLSERSDITKPLIAAVNGFAFGGGFEIVLACDIVVASANAIFAMSEPRVGAVALGGGAQRLAMKVPHNIAMGLLLTGRRIDAAAAERAGLVNEVVAPGAALDAARRWASEILECAPLAVRHTKKLALEASQRADTAALIAARREEIEPLLFASEDTREGIRAFVEKRKPLWRAR